jgi:hypothetical protein
MHRDVVDSMSNLRVHGTFKSPDGLYNLVHEETSPVRDEKSNEQHSEKALRESRPRRMQYVEPSLPSPASAARATSNTITTTSAGALPKAVVNTGRFVLVESAHSISVLPFDPRPDLDSIDTHRHLSRVTFRSTPVCFDVNMNSSSTVRLDVVVGFESGDCLLYDTFDNTNQQFNKNVSMERNWSMRSSSTDEAGAFYNSSLSF